MKYEFHVGDKVMIRPDYWEELSQSPRIIDDYKENGGDFVYTIAHAWYDDDGYCYDVALAEGDGSWNHPERYLMHVQEPFEDADIEIGGDIL